MAFVAHNSRSRLFLLLLLGLGFVSAGLWWIGAFGEVPPSRRYGPVGIKVLGWLCVLFFGLCSIVYARRLFDMKPHLEINQSGILNRAWSSDTIPWSEIADVTSWSHRRQQCIILHLRNPARYPARGFLQNLLAGPNRMLTDGDIAISLTGTDRSFGEAMSAIDHFLPQKTDYL